MNAKKFSDAMSELDTKYVDEALSYDKSHMSKVRPRKLGILIAAVIAVLALCGFAAYELGLFDPWFQKPSTDPVQTVQSAIEGQADKEYTISVRVDEIKVDESETERIIQMYTGSDLAKARGWTDEYLAEHFVVVWAKYYVEYDHTKTFLDDGLTEQYFYLTQDTKSGEWTISDNTSPNILAACNQQNELTGQSLASFSYEEDAAIYKDGNPGVNPNKFVNVDVYPIETQSDAVERAINECTIEHNATSAYYDSNVDMWRIDFLTVVHNEDGIVATPGNCQSVYMNSDGITQLIVYGE